MFRSKLVDGVGCLGAAVLVFFAFFSCSNVLDDLLGIEEPPLNLDVVLAATEVESNVFLMNDNTIDITTTKWASVRVEVNKDVVHSGQVVGAGFGDSPMSIELDLVPSETNVLSITSTLGEQSMSVVHNLLWGVADVAFEIGLENDTGDRDDDHKTTDARLRVTGVPESKLTLDVFVDGRKRLFSGEANVLSLIQSNLLFDLADLGLSRPEGNESQQILIEATLERNGATNVLSSPVAFVWLAEPVAPTLSLEEDTGLEGDGFTTNPKVLVSSLVGSGAVLSFEITTNAKAHVYLHLPGVVLTDFGIGLPESDKVEVVATPVLRWLGHTARGSSLRYTLFALPKVSYVDNGDDDTDGLTTKPTFMVDLAETAFVSYSGTNNDATPVSFAARRVGVRTSVAHEQIHLNELREGSRLAFGEVVDGILLDYKGHGVSVLLDGLGGHLPPLIYKVAVYSESVDGLSLPEGLALAYGGGLLVVSEDQKGFGFFKTADGSPAQYYGSKRLNSQALSVLVSPFSSVNHMSLGPGGLLYVADEGGKKVFVFGLNLESVAQYGMGSYAPKSLLVDGQSLFVGTTNGVVVFALRTGAVATNFGQSNKTYSGLSFDQNNVLHAVRKDGWVEAYVGSVSRGFARQHDLNMKRQLGVSSLDHESMHIDDQGVLYVSDGLRHQVFVLVYDGSSAPYYRVVSALGEANAPGSATNKFNVPSSMATHDNKLYVSDANNHRVQVFELSEDRRF